MHDTETADPIQAGIEAAVGGIEDGPNKLYWLGKVAFVTYWILSSYGQRETPQAQEERDRAEQYLRLALECPWREDHARRLKDFIAELLARLYISKGAPERAIEVIQTHRKGPFLEPYIAHTLGLAFVLAGQYMQAEEVLRGAAVNRANRAVWTSSPSWVQ